MTLLEQFERAHLKYLHARERATPTEAAFRTPDGTSWRISEIVRGWQPRISDGWALSTLHQAVLSRRVEVRHLPLPHTVHRIAEEEILGFLDDAVAPGERRPPLLFGTADWASDELAAEIGTCAPAKFYLNLLTDGRDMLIAPEDADVAFIFRKTVKSTNRERRRK